MPQFRKKPIVVDAEQFRLAHKPYPAGVVPIVVDQDEGHFIGLYNPILAEQRGKVAFDLEQDAGWVVATDGSWIVTGTRGERYAVKAEVFEEIFERVSARARDQGI